MADDYGDHMQELKDVLEDLDKGEMTPEERRMAQDMGVLE